MTKDNIIAAGNTYTLSAIASPTYTGGTAGNVTDATVVDAENAYSVKSLTWTTQIGDGSENECDGTISGSAGDIIKVNATATVSYKEGETTKTADVKSSVTLTVGGLPSKTPSRVVTWSEYINSIDDVLLPDNWSWEEKGSVFENNKRYTAVYKNTGFYPVKEKVRVEGINGLDDDVISLTGSKGLYGDGGIYYSIKENSINVDVNQAYDGESYGDYLPEYLCKLTKVESSDAANAALTGSVDETNVSYSGAVSKPTASFDITATYELGAAVYYYEGGEPLKKAFSGTKTLTQSVVIVDKAPISKINLDITRNDEDLPIMPSGWGWDDNYYYFAYYDITTAKKREALEKEQKFTLVVTPTYLNLSVDDVPDEAPEFDITYTGANIVSAVQDTTDKTKINVTISASAVGHATMILTAKDEGRCSAYLDIDINDFEPKLEATYSPKINRYYKYDGAAEMNGRALELLVPYESYSNDGYSNISVKVMKGDGKTLAKGISSYVDYSEPNYGKYATATVYVYVSDCAQITDDMKGKKPYKLLVTSKYEEKAFDAKINIDFTKVKVTCKQSNKVNTFFTDTSHEKYTYDPAAMGLITFNPNISSVQGVKWTPKAGGAKKLDFEWDNGNTYVIYQQGLEKKKDNITDDDKVGKLEITLSNVKDPYVIENFKIKTVYKKPKLSVPQFKLYKGSGSTRTMTTNAYASYKKIVRNITELYPIAYLYPTSNKTQYVGLDYDSFALTNPVDGITMTDSTGYGPNCTTIVYTGDKKSLTAPITVKSKYWAEDLEVKAKIKVITVPKKSPKLGNSKVTLNLNYPAEENRTGSIPYLYDANTLSTIDCAKFEITGQNAKAKALLEDDVINIAHSRFSNAYELKVSLSSASAMGKTAAKGTYKFKVVPYELDASKSDGVGEALKAQTLTVKIIDEKGDIAVKTSGKIDLVKLDYYGYNYSPKSAVKVTPKIPGRNSDSRITNIEIIGDHSEDFKYFAMNGKYVRDGRINNDGVVYIAPKRPYGDQTLKAGKTYKLKLRYTIEDYDWKTFAAKQSDKPIVLETNEFSITPVQSTPKIKVKPGSVTLDIKEDYGAYAVLTVPKGYVVDGSATGGIDLDKDDDYDISISSDYSWGDVNEEVLIQIVNKNAIKVLKNGTKLKIPVTMPLRGRDGTTKDPTATITVTIKNK